MAYKIKNNIFIAVLFLAGAGLFNACRESFQVDNEDSGYPLTLNAIRQNDAISFNWEAAQVSSFEKYVLIRATEPLPDGLKPNQSSTAFQIVFEGEQIDQNSFTDNSLPFADSLYYKLFVKFDGRFVESRAVQFGFDNYIEPGVPSIVRFLPDSNWVIIGDELNSHIMVVNYITGKRVNRISSTVGSSGSETNVAEAYTQNGKAYLYWLTGNGSTSLNLYTLPDLTIYKNFATNTTSTFDLQINEDKNTLLLTAYDFSNSLQVFRASDFVSLNATFRSEYYLRRPLALLDPNSNRFVEVAPNRILAYNINAGTGALSGQVETTAFPGTPLKQIVQSPGREFFIPTFAGQILNRQLNEIARLPVPVNGNFVDFAFSADGQFVYTAINSFFVGNQTTIQKFSFPALKLLEERVFANVSPQALWADDEGLVFIGSNLNGQQRFIVKKLNF